MKKKVDEKVSSPFQGGLSLIGMEFASKGLSWAGDVYQKLENVTLDNIVGQNPSKLVDAFGEHFRKICEEVADDWLNPYSDGCVKVPVSELSLEHEVITEVCQKSKISLDEHPVNEKSPALTALDANVSSGDDNGLASPINLLQDAGAEEECDSICTNSISTTVHSGWESYSETSEHPENVSGLLGRNTPLSDKVHPSVSCGDKAAERGKVLSICATSTEEDSGKWKVISLPAGNRKEEVPEDKENIKEASLPQKEIENLDDFDGTESMGGHVVIDTISNVVDEFENVGHEDCWDNSEQNKTLPILRQENQNASYKKKLSNVFRTKLRSSKRSEQVATRTFSIDVSDRYGSSSQDPDDFEWELL